MTTPTGSGAQHTIAALSAVVERKILGRFDAVEKELIPTYGGTFEEE